MNIRDWSSDVCSSDLFAGDTPAAFSDPARGAELARSQIDRGADVILQAAGDRKSVV